MTMQSGFQVSGGAPENYERYNPVIMAPFVDAVIEQAGVRPGAMVLDVACGTGFATRRASEVAGVQGRVTGLDLNPGMLAMARTLATPAGGATIEWHEGSALELPFADGSFDTIICQQGLQFFPDLDRAVHEMHRVLAPGGHVAVTFWAALDGQTYMRAQNEALQHAIGDALAPLAGAFRLDPDRASRAFSAAGFLEVQAHRMEITTVLPPMDQFAARQVGTLPVAPAFAALDEPRRIAFVREMESALAAYRTTSGEYACPIASWVVSGQR